MVVVPTRMTVEHPEDLVSWFVEPSVKARKWVSEGGSRTVVAAVQVKVFPIPMPFFLA